MRRGRNAAVSILRKTLLEGESLDNGDYQTNNEHYNARKRVLFRRGFPRRVGLSKLFPKVAHYGAYCITNNRSVTNGQGNQNQHQVRL